MHGKIFIHMKTSMKERKIESEIARERARKSGGEGRIFFFV